MQEKLVAQSQSITLSPSHECIPALTEFLQHAELEAPNRAQLLETLRGLNSLHIKQFVVELRGKKCKLMFRINEKRQFEGAGDTFDEALLAALESVMTHFAA